MCPKVLDQATQLYFRYDSPRQKPLGPTCCQLLKRQVSDKNAGGTTRSDGTNGQNY